MRVIYREAGDDACTMKDDVLTILPVKGVSNQIRLYGPDWGLTIYSDDIIFIGE